MRMSGVDVAVIDDGVCPESYLGVAVKESYLVTADGKITEYHCTREECRHGSACAAIISKYAPGVFITSLKVMDEPVEIGAVDRVIAALEWCEEHKVKVCHLSIGIPSVKYYGRFQSILGRMKKKGQIVVVAMANNDRFALPGCLGEVISVKADRSLSEDGYYCGKGRLGEPDFFASGCHCLKDQDGKRIILEGGNSYAAPVITAKVVEELAGYRKSILLRQRWRGRGLHCNARGQLFYLEKCLGTFKEVTVPVVVFWGEKKESIKRAQRFRAYLGEKGYLSVVLSGRIAWKNGEIVKIPHTREMDRWLGLMENYYAIDIILLCVRKKADYENGDLYLGDNEQEDDEEMLRLLS